MTLTALATLAGLLAADCNVASVSIAGKNLHLDVANTQRERARGLMHRETLPPDGGMIFAYPNARHVRYWMKDTPLPLDMIFLNSAGVVQSIHENAIPNDRTPINGGDGIQFVIEVEAGGVTAIGIEKGEKIDVATCAK